MSFENTDSVIDKMLVDDLVPGVSYAIFDRNQIIQKVIGNSQTYPSKLKLKPNQVYDLASLTKVLGTVPVILYLIERNKIKLEDSITKYLPTWNYPQVTVRHLITHTSGINGYIENRDALSAIELKQALLNLSINQKFNQEIEYADVNFIFLGWIIEKITQMSVQTAINELILKPLNLTNTNFKPTKRLTVPTELTSKRGLINGEVHDPKAFVLKEHCGSAGMFSNLSDLIKYGKWLLGQTSYPQTLADQAVKQIYLDQTPMHSNLRSLGWEIRSSNDDYDYIVHTGFTGTILVFNQELQRGLIFLSNRVHPKPNLEFLNRRQVLINTFINEK